VDEYIPRQVDRHDRLVDHTGSVDGGDIPLRRRVAVKGPFVEFQ
jgi:hypothetical protein